MLNSPSPRRHSGIPLPELEQARLRALVTEHGEMKTAAALGVSRVTVVRALAGLPLYSVTRIALEAKLDTGVPRAA